MRLNDPTIPLCSLITAIERNLQVRENTGLQKPLAYPLPLG
jgi:hypothetical protein